jgi:putative nucleotidyltransferase with HDIG domain
MDAQTVKNRIERVEALTTIPGVAHHVIELVGNAKSSVTEISEFISRDAALTTKILKMINSALYGFPNRISSVNQAVLLLGLSTVKALLLSVAVHDLMQQAMTGLWEHSIGCAIVSRLIARKKGLREPEECSVYGLLHDIGKVILARQFPDLYGEALLEVRTKGTTILLAERECFSVDHATVGAWVAERWSFPKQLVETIRWHHKPHLSHDAKEPASIAHIADFILTARGFGFAGDQRVPDLDASAWDLIGISNAELRDILKEMEDLLDEVEDLTM